MMFRTRLARIARHLQPRPPAPLSEYGVLEAARTGHVGGRRLGQEEQARLQAQAAQICAELQQLLEERC